MLTRRDFNKTVLSTGTTLLATGGAWPAAEPLALPDPSPSETSNLDCDLLIKGGTVVDPGQRLHEPMDVAVKDRKILAVAKDIPEGRARNVLSARGKIVTPGLIDIHVHCFAGVGPGMNADDYCVRRGVTTVADAGSTGYFELGVFVKHMVRTSATRIYPLAHIKATGTTANTIKYRSANGKIERDIPDWMHPELTARAALDHRPYVVGIKTRIGEDVQGNNEEVDCLRMTVRAAELTQRPLMAHLDEMYTPLPEFLKLMRKGDVFTHFLNNHKHGVLDANGKLLPEVVEARQRGIIFDVGHGTKPGRMSFDVAEKCFDQGFLPDTISTDLDALFGKVTSIVIDMPTEVSKFLALGMDLDKAIACVTVNPAKVFDFGVKIGSLQPGYEADIGIFELQEGTFKFDDHAGGQRTGRQRLVNEVTICRGDLFVNRI